MSKKKHQPEDELPTEEELKDSGTKALKLMCNQHGINASGNKAIIVKRLASHFEELRAERAPPEEEPDAKGSGKEEKESSKEEPGKEEMESSKEEPGKEEQKKKERGGDGFPSNEELKSSNTKTLKLMCNQHGINSSGNKDTIVRRLCGYFDDLREDKAAESVADEGPKKEAKKKKDKAKKKDDGKKKKDASKMKDEAKKKDEEKKKEEAKKKDKEKKKEEAEKKEEAGKKLEDGGDKKKPPKEGKEDGPVEAAPIPHSHKDDDYPYACSLCNTKLTGEEDECPGCQVTFGGTVAALIDHDWDVYEDIPTPEEVKKMGKAQLKDICNLLGFDEKMTTAEMRELILDLIQEEGTDDIVEIIGEEDIDSFDPKRALEETNYIRDSLHKYSEALELYDRIIEWEMQHKRVNRLEDALLQKGICLQYMNEFSKARECYVLAQEVNPKNPEIKALLMGVNALDQFYENKEQKNALDPEATALKDRILDLLDDDGTTKTKRIIETDYSPGFSQTGETRIEMAIPKKPKDEPAVKKEADYTLPEDTGPGKDEEILEEMDEMSDRLKRLKELKDSIDLGDLETSAPKGSGIVIDKVVAKAEPIEVPEVQDVPEPPEVEAEIVEETAEFEAEIVEETAEPEAEIITPEVVDDKKEVEAELVGEEPLDGPGDDEVEAEIITEEVEAEVETVPRPKVDPTVAEEGIIPTGNASMDKLINGGIPASTNVMVTAPPFVGKEMILFDFIRNGLARNKPSIIITTGDPIMVIRTKMNQVMPDFGDYEKKKMVSWVDPRSDTIRERFPPEDPKGPEDHEMIIRAVDAITAEYIENNGGCNIIFVSLTPIVSYRDPNEIKDFLEALTSKVEGMNQVALYGVDSDMHDDSEMTLMEETMSGIIEIKENQNSRSKNDRSLIMIKKMPGSKQTRWVPFNADETSYKIG